MDFNTKYIKFTIKSDNWIIMVEYKIEQVKNKQLHLFFLNSKNNSYLNLLHKVHIMKNIL